MVGVWRAFLGGASLVAMALSGADAVTCGQGSATGGSPVASDGPVGGGAPGQCGLGWEYDSARSGVTCTGAGPACDSPQSECCKPRACASVGDLDAPAGVGIVGGLKLTNANDAVTMAAAQPSDVYVSGATANASMLTQSIQGTFICDAGYKVDPLVMFVCETTGGSAKLSRQPCIKMSCAATQVANSVAHAAAGSIVGQTGATVTVQCKAGYAGGGAYKCTAGAVGAAPTFQGANCVAAPEPEPEPEGGDEEDECKDPNGNPCPENCCSGGDYSVCSAYDEIPEGTWDAGQNPGCRAEGAIGTFYAVFGGVVAFTWLMFFLKNHLGGSNDADKAQP